MIGAVLIPDVLLNANRRSESRTQSQCLAKGVLHMGKGWERDATLQLPGLTRLRAGLNVKLAGFGVREGLWMIQSARHEVSRSNGYTTELEVRHVAW